MFLSLALAAVMSLVAPAAPAPAPAPAPQMSIDSVEFDAGEVTRPQKITHEFIVENTGKGDLRLKVVPHCGCTAAFVDETVAPGKTGKIALSVDTSRFQGPVVKSATLTTNDPSKASMELTMKGIVKVPPGEAPVAAAPAAPAPTTH